MNRNDKVIDEQYKAWVKKRGVCLIGTDCWDVIDFDHIRARGTEEHKRNDHLGLLLCRKHHVERGNMGDSRFQQVYGVNLYQEIALSLSEYIQWLKAQNSQKVGKDRGYSF